MCIVASDGQVVDRFTVTHTVAGLTRLVRRLAKAGVVEVGIERVDGPVVETLMQAGVTVLVIHPHQVKNLRSRYGSSGNKDDRFDAYVLADVVRTDRRRLIPLTRSSPATNALRTVVRSRTDLVTHRVAACNQLRAHLHLVFPAAVTLFAKLDSGISLDFLARFPTQTEADWLTEKRLTKWLATARYSGGIAPAVLYAKITDAPRGITSGDTSGDTSGITSGDTSGPSTAGENAAATAATAAGYAATTAAYVGLLRTLTAQISVLDDAIATQLTAHPDAHIVTSLPRSGCVRAAKLLAEIGDVRGRFPTPESLAALAGVAPSTRQSGKIKAVTFRWSADKHLREALTDFAGDSRRANPWAADLYDRARARGHDHPHAVRILARAWAHVIWRCWQDGTAYNPAAHNALQRVLAQTPQQAA